MGNFRYAKYGDDAEVLGIDDPNKLIDFTQEEVTAIKALVSADGKTIRDQSGTFLLDDSITSPISISGCELWLDAISGPLNSSWAVPTEGQAVAQWTDNSGNGRHATVSSGTPLYSAAGGLGGNPAVGGGRMVTPGFLTSGMGSGGWTLFCVSKAPASFSGQKIKVSTATANVWISHNGTTGNRDITIAGLTGFSSNTQSAARADGIDVLSVSPTAVKLFCGDTGNSSTASTASLSTTITVAATAWSTSAIHVGDASFGGFTWPGNVSAVIFYSRALTDSEIRRVYAYLSARYEPTPLLSMLGNSLTSGTGSTGGATQALSAAGTNLPGRLLALMGGRIVTDAYPGRTGAQLISETPAYTGIFNPPRTVTFVWEGTNTLATTGSLLLAYDQIVRMCEARSGAQRKVAVGTVLYRNDTGNNTKNRALTDQLNTLIRNNYSSFADALIDFAGDVRLQDPANSTYFDADTIHLKDAGYAVAASIAQGVLAGQIAALA